MKQSNKVDYLDKDTVLRGEIKTSNLVLEGSVTGDIYASDQVYLRSHSTVEGDIYAQKIVFDENCLHEGMLKMDPKLETESSGSKTRGRMKNQDTEATKAPVKQNPQVLKRSEKRPAPPESGKKNSSRRLW